MKIRRSIKKGAFERLFLRLQKIAILCLSLTTLGFPTSLVAELYLPHSKICAADQPTGLAGNEFDEYSRVRYVHDGDTVHLQDGRKVRLIGINTPELARKNKAAEPFAMQAKLALQTLLARDKDVALVYGKDNHDRYGRLLAHLFLSNGTNVQSALLEQGLASALILPPNTRFAKCYLEKERQARCNNTGIWQQHGLIEASDLNKSDLGFHLVTGKLINIDFNNKGIWLNLDNKLTVGIRTDEEYLFNRKMLKSLLNQTVIVRGWINKKGRHLPQKSDFYMRIKHPLSVQAASRFQCD